jgi:hypothetical protein
LKLKCFSTKTCPFVPPADLEVGPQPDNSAILIRDGDVKAVYCMSPKTAFYRFRRKMISTVNFRNTIFKLSVTKQHPFLLQIDESPRLTGAFSS